MHQTNLMFGHQEVTIPAPATGPGDLSSLTQILAARPNERINVFRIRGTGAGVLQLFDGTTEIGPEIIAGDNFDVPGIHLRLSENTALQIQNSVSTDTQVTVHYSYSNVNLPPSL